MKPRQKPYELIIYEYLLHRKVFSNNEKRQYHRLKRGYEGELYFDEQMKKILHNYILLKDLWLIHNQRTFQIDHALLINNHVYLYEVKNYAGTYYYQDGRFYHESDKESDDPLTQLQRTESLLRQLLHHYGFQPSIQATVAFVNPTFTLFQAPYRSKILLPTQLDNHFKQFQAPYQLHPQLSKMATTLQTLKLDSSPFLKRPLYEYKNLTKGISCKYCGSITIQITGKIAYCDTCGEKELCQKAILRIIDECKTLFPESVITTRFIQDWSGNQLSKDRILYVLNKHFCKKGEGKGTYFV